ncbi:MAG: CoA transferase [Chloroflexi bacterium]|nr:CoA transferase [Chloroflexota bacterium]
MSVNHTPTAFEGLRVLDLTQAVAGPYCTRLLAGFGANVLKIERPCVGDVSRQAGPFLNDLPHPERSGLFLHLNGGKRSISLNLKTPTGRQIFLALLEDADVLLESYRPGTMARLGLSYDDLKERRPGLVYVSISNYGQTGPNRDWEAVDLIAQATGGGAMYSHGILGEEPLKFAGNTGQYYAGAMAALATVGAAFAAKTQGIGQHLDLSIQEALLSSTESKPIDYLYTGNVLSRGSNANSSRTSYLMGAFPGADGFIGLQGSGRGETWWLRVYQMMGMPELADDPRFSTPEARDANRDELDVLWYLWLADRTRQEVFAAAQQARFPLAPVYTPEDVVNDPHYNARGFFEQVRQPAVGVLKQPGSPLKMFGTPWETGQPAPTLGRHNAEVYVGRLGLSNEDLRRLRAAGVI